MQRGLDLFLAGLCLLLLLPIAIFSYPLLLWLIGAPVIFHQKRMGKNGQIFTMYKVRSMYKNAEITKHLYLASNQAPAPMFKIGDDHRFIKKSLSWPGQKNSLQANVGQFLSRSGLDELPQIINIIKGEMSWFGPRPLPVKEALALAQIDPAWAKWRQTVLPGIFSAWALDPQHNKSLSHWKKLEHITINMSQMEKYSTIYRVVYKQLRNILKTK